MPSPSSNSRKPTLRLGYRSPHRMRSHDEAHAQGANDAAPPVLEHPLVPRGEPTLVCDQRQLQALVDELRGAGRFGYDSEFIGEYTFYPKLCVIQVATCERVVLIDPLASVDLTPFWQLLADPAVEKIVHAGSQDLEPVVRLLDQAPANVFDIQVAAAFTGRTYPIALGKLADQVAGADLGPGFKFSQWDSRPLSPVQMRYAANDVRYLPLLRNNIHEQLEAAGNTAWAMQECEALCDPSLYRFDPHAQRIRARGIEQLTPRKRAVLRALVGWRGMTAQEHDLPPRSLVNDSVMYELARSPVQTVEQLQAVRGLPRPVKQHHGQQIVQVIAEALDGPLPPRSRRPAPLGDCDRALVDAVWQQVQQACDARSISTAIVTSKKDVGRLVRAAVDGEPAPPRLLTGWRRHWLAPILGQVDARIAQLYR